MQLQNEEKDSNTHLENSNSLHLYYYTSKLHSELSTASEWIDDLLLQTITTLLQVDIESSSHFKVSEDKASLTQEPIFDSFTCVKETQNQNHFTSQAMFIKFTDF